MRRLSSKLVRFDCSTDVRFKRVRRIGPQIDKTVSRRSFCGQHPLGAGSKFDAPRSPGGIGCTATDEEAEHIDGRAATKTHEAAHRIGVAIGGGRYRRAGRIIRVYNPSPRQRTIMTGAGTDIGTKACDSHDGVKLPRRIRRERIHRKSERVQGTIGKPDRR